MFSFWHYFGCPAIFFTVTPCDECSFCVRLYATCKEHKLPNITDINDQSRCLLDFEARKKWREKYPGACTMEYENIVQIVIKAIIGWNQSEQKGYNGAFGIPLAYGDSCEEQARYTLHSHISVWIENFNIVCNLLFHENESIRNSAHQRLECYFEKIAQASFGDLYLAKRNIATNISLLYKTNDVLDPPDDNELRLMRHHTHCKDLHGKTGILSEDFFESSSNNAFTPERALNSNQLVEMNTQARLRYSRNNHKFSKEQLDILAYTYPYHMQGNTSMLPLDFQKKIDQKKIDHIENCINNFNIRHPLLQLRFNLHNHYHRPSCFKKGPDCRANLPQPHTSIGYIFFDDDNTINWHFIDGTIKKVTPFKYFPKRNIGDQFMNINNDLATTIFACNNNITLGDRVYFYYVTLYQTKKNQNPFHSVCLALSKRIKVQKDKIPIQSSNDETTEEIAPDFCEGLKRMLSAIYAHTVNNFLSRTMAWKILYQGSRFRFSHKTGHIPLYHLVEWAEGGDNLSFKLKKITRKDKTADHIVDMFINNIIYRPFELNNLSCYELISNYEWKATTKKDDDENFNVEGKTTFNLCEEHPLYKIW